MRRLSLAFAIVAAALVGATGAAAGKGDPKRAITKADQAAARAMLLRRADLAPGFVAQASQSDPDIYCAALDESDLTVTGDAETPLFTRQRQGSFLTVASTATLYRSQVQALSAWRRGTSAAGERCARSLLAEELAATGARVSSFRRVSFPRLAPLTVAYRIVLAGGSGSGAVTIYVDVVALQRGRAQAAVTVLSLGAPLVRSETIALAEGVAERMRSALG